MSRLTFALVLMALAAGADAAEAVSDTVEKASAEDVQVIPEAAAEPVPEPAADPAANNGLEVIGEAAVEPEHEPLPPIPRPSMNYIGFSAFEYASEPANGGSGAYWSGPGAAFEFGWEPADFTVLTGRFRRTEAELERSSGIGELTEDHYELSLAFAAPLGERTRLLLEMGWAREEFQIETHSSSAITIITDDSQGLYAAIELRAMLGRWFELDLRSAGHQLFDTRRQVHSGGFRFHVSRRVAFGVHHELWERDLRETTLTSLDMRVGF